ncbi:DUF2147 domain-containing protein [bacterium SCSIO 12741]|nr:DUF2147 domain-containing protein [bacterium SCSIO 12741]
MIRNCLLILLINLLAITSFAQTPDEVLGRWKTIDDETGKEKSIVELYKENGKLYGKVVKILNPDKVDAKCDKCEGELKDKPILGMVIVNDMEWDDDEWDDGTILDPNKGSVYDCKIWLDEDDKNTLYVRGYIGFLFRTQNWIRVK